MKKHLLIVGLMFTFPFSPATAVTKCVALNSGTECSYVYPGAYAVDWTLNCTSNGTNITISGISQCSSTSGQHRRPNHHVLDRQQRDRRQILLVQTGFTRCITLGVPQHDNKCGLLCPQLCT